MCSLASEPAVPGVAHRVRQSFVVDDTSGPRPTKAQPYPGEDDYEPMLESEAP